MNLEDVRQSLETRLDQLTGRITIIESELRTRGSDDSQDRATESENQEVLEKLSESEREEVREIRAALGRIRAGNYTVCAGCGSDIPTERLEAVPYTSQCVNCAA